MKPSNFSELGIPEEIRAVDLEGIIEPEYMNNIVSTILYILNNQGKLPPQLSDNNLGIIIASNIPCISSIPNFKTGVLDIDMGKAIKGYAEVQQILGQNIDSKYCLYPLHLKKTSNSSRFIHGLDLNDLLNKWYNQFEQNPLLLKNYIIENFLDKLHIDEDIEIFSAEIVNNSLFLRIKNDEFDVTIPMGYGTKHKTYTNEKGETIILRDSFGNIFAPQGVESIKYHYTDEQISEMIDNTHELGGTIMMNFYPWRSPEYVTKDNYKYYYHTVVENKDMSDEEAILSYDGVLHHYDDGLRVVVKRVNGDNGYYLSTTQDQILPDFGRINGNELEKENYEYWERVFKAELFRLIDFGVDNFRIDLAHGFRKNKECDLLKNLIIETVEYAKSIKNKKIYFVLETYDFGDWGGSTPSFFTGWNENFDYPSIKVYHATTEEKFTTIRNYEGIDHLVGDLKYLFQNTVASNTEMTAIASFDDKALIDIADKAGIDNKYILEIIFLLGKAGYNVLSTDRDIKGERGEDISTVPGGSGGDNSEPGDFKTHCLPTEQELKNHLEKDYLTLFKESEGLKILKEVNKLPKIIGLTIEGDSLIFNFFDNSQRIFNFRDLINGGVPYTVRSEEKPVMLGEQDRSYLIKLKELEEQLTERLKVCMLSYTKINSNIPNIDDHVFWNDFAEFVKLMSNIKYGVEIWDTEKHEAYFKLNREELIESYFKYRNISLPEKNNIEDLVLSDDNIEILELSQQIKELRMSLKRSVKYIIRKSIKNPHHLDLLK